MALKNVRRNFPKKKPPMMEDDGMDFSPQKNSNDFDRDSFEDDEFIEIQSATSKAPAHSQGPPDRKPKPKNKPAQIEKPSPANLHHVSTMSPGLPHSQTSETSATSANNSETVVGNGSLESSRITRSNSLESSISSASASASSANVKRHTGGDSRWEAIQQATAQETALNLGHFRLLKRLGYGDIGSVYLVELRGTSAFFAMKVMDKASLISRNKMARAQTEREILVLLDHPFLPTLYTHFETDKFHCLVMEYCSGGNLHSLRQKQPAKHFTEQAARFYTAEILLAMEYLHMLGIVYRDLKPENVLVREDGHIMLSDFDLSLRCSVSPTLVKSSSVHNTSGNVGAGVGGIGSPRAGLRLGAAVLRQPHSRQVFFGTQHQRERRRRRRRHWLGRRGRRRIGSQPGLHPAVVLLPAHPAAPQPEGVQERGGIGSAGEGGEGLGPNQGCIQPSSFFPRILPRRSRKASKSEVNLNAAAAGEEPQKRIAFTRGATEIKQHPFFEGVNWALVRSMAPPSVPEPVDYRQYAAATGKEKNAAESATAKSSTGEAQSDFEYF
uniref:non-specific serine/threonine protein kinase n=1 Tax=Aegilops tauschii TaxID=37682 RepID=M8CPE3_AEGTA